MIKVNYQPEMVKMGIDDYPNVLNFEALKKK
jgi:hypothetical protein